jgi:hypothetical protein
MKVKSSVKISTKDKKKGLFCKIRRNKKGVKRVYKLQNNRKKNGWVN